MHQHIFDHYVQHKVCQAETQPYKNIQKYVAFHMPGLFKNISNTAACMKRQDKIVSFPTLSLAGPHAKLQFSFLVLPFEHTYDSGKIFNFKITFRKRRSTGLEETKTIIITTANEQQVKIHTFYITIN